MPEPLPPAPSGHADAQEAVASGPRTRRFALALVVAVTLVSAVHLVQLAHLPEHGVFTKYPAAAADLLAGRLGPARMAELSPAYLWAMVGALALGASPALVSAAQVAGLGLAALLAAAVVWRRAGPLGGAVAALAVLCSRMALVNATDLEPETLVLVLDAVALWLLARPRPRATAAGLVLGAAVAARPTALLAAGVGALWLMWQGGETGRRRLLPPARFAAALLLPLVLVAAAARAATGGWVLMDPGYVFYEGWNPRATGLAGEDPIVVKDVEHALGFPDALHEAYRTVAARAEGAPLTSAEANRYWTAHATAWVLTAPVAAARLLGRKMHGVVSSYAAWDLLTAALTERSLPRGPWLPFGLLAAFAAAGALAGRRDPVTALLVGFAAARALVPLAFYASARLRDPMIPALACLAGLGAGVALAGWRRGRRRTVAAAVAGVVVAGLALSVPSHAEREDRHAWDLVLEARAAQRRAREATDPATAESWRLRADLDLVEPASTPPALRRQAVRQRLGEATFPARRFDLAVAAARAGDWTTADRILAGLQAAGYRPVRGWALCSSVAYQRARARLHLGDARRATAMARRALAEAPGDPDVLALAARLERGSGHDAAAARLDALLDRLHDPFTAGRARATAALDDGDTAAARRQIHRLRDGLPELAPVG